MEIIHSDFLMGSTAMSTCWSQGSEEGSTTSGVRKGDRSKSLEENLKEPAQGNSAVLPLHNHICSGSVGNECTEKDTKEQKEMPGKQKPSDKREAQPMVRETTGW